VERALIPYSAAGNFAASDGTFVYTGGGLADGFVVHNDLFRYDPSGDSWTSLAPSPDYYFAAPGVYFNGKIYIMGGFDETFQPRDTTRIYDIATNTWEPPGAPMPAALGCIAALWNGIIYVAGGSPDVGVSVVNTLYAYNIAANSWTTLAPMPKALWVQGFGAIHGKLYVAGGSDSVNPLNTLYIYDIRSNTWTTGANLPAAAGAAGSAVLHNQLYLFGGLPTAILTQIYDPVSNTWSFGPNLNIDRWRFYATAVRNHSIVILGGQNANGAALDDNDQLKARRCRPRP
jgi:N-acetylneuraminic acid mutarotase